MKILALVKDLVASSQIKEASLAAGFEYRSARSLSKFKEILETEAPERVIIDLGHEGEDPFQAIVSSKQRLSADNIICFFPHVNAELEERAASLGLTRIYRRSKFFNDLAHIVLG